MEQHFVGQQFQVFEEVLASRNAQRSRYKKHIRWEFFHWKHGMLESRKRFKESRKRFQESKKRFKEGRKRFKESRKRCKVENALKKVEKALNKVTL